MESGESGRGSVKGKWYVYETFDQHMIEVHFTTRIEYRDLVDKPREELVGFVVERFRNGFVREINSWERKRDGHHAKVQEQEDSTAVGDRVDRSSDRGNDVTG